MRNTLVFVSLILIGASCFAQPTQYSGIYWDPDEPGFGFSFDFQRDLVFAAVYAYDGAGANRFMTLQGVVETGSPQNYVGEVFVTEKGPDGSLTSFSAGSFEFSLSPVEGQNGVLISIDSPYLSFDGRQLRRFGFADQDSLSVFAERRWVFTLDSQLAPSVSNLDVQFGEERVLVNGRESLDVLKNGEKVGFALLNPFSGFIVFVREQNATTFLKGSVVSHIGAKGSYDQSGLPSKGGMSGDTLAYFPLNQIIDGAMSDTSGLFVANVSNLSVLTGIAVDNGDSVGNAFHFDGNSRIEFGTLLSLEGTTDFTISCWVRAESGSFTRTVIAQRNGGFNGEYILRINQQGRPQFTVFGDNQFQFDLVPEDRIDDGDWHHLLVLREGPEGRVYVDGNLVVSGAGAMAVNLDSNLSVGIGDDLRDAGLGLVGDLDALRLFTFAASDSLIEDLASESQRNILAGLSISPVAFTDSGTFIGVPVED